jgi:hypothetical protein
MNEHLNFSPATDSTRAASGSRRHRLAFGGLLVLLLSGCQAMVPNSWRIPPKHPPARVVTRSTLDAADLFAYTQRLLALGRDELTQEVSARRDRASTTHSALDRAKLAVALTLPSQGQRDTTRALLAISDVPRDDPSLDASNLALINYIEALLAWQARQEEALQALLQPERTPASTAAAAASPPPEVASLQALAQKLRSDQKRSDGQIESLTARLRDERARADGLQQKLDALGNLEKSLAERKPARAETPR